VPPQYVANSWNCYLIFIVKNTEASLVEIESRDRHHKRFASPTHSR